MATRKTPQSDPKRLTQEHFVFIILHFGSGATPNIAADRLPDYFLKLNLTTGDVGLQLHKMYIVRRMLASSFGVFQLKCQ